MSRAERGGFGSDPLEARSSSSRTSGIWYLIKSGRLSYCIGKEEAEGGRGTEHGCRNRGRGNRNTGMKEQEEKMRRRIDE
jgi:hypothetical protein